jgi:hypothetical protein
METVGEPVDEDTAEIVDPTPLQCFVDEPEERSADDDSCEGED